MKEKAPFLKMYSDYVNGYNNATNIIESFQKRDASFADIVNEIQKLPECGNLPLTHHLITPVQRVPRYEILLKEYLKRLPEKAEDRSDAKGKKYIKKAMWIKKILVSFF